MNLQARKHRASPTSPLDSIEVVLDTDNQALASAVHTIELVSGVNVTHGGGAQPGEYLHYKAVERDADDDGIIDYSNVIMELAQEVEGISVIKANALVITKSEADAYRTAVESFKERKEVAEGAEEEFTEVAPTLTPTVLKTGEITLEWSTDTFV